MTRVKSFAVLLLAIVAPGLAAQSYFGQNQVQFDKLRWKVIETDHFLVHYYPEERDAVMDAARMAERSYARLSKLLNHQFREKKPLILYRSRGDFAQNNVTGDLGEGTGGVTEALRHRILLPFTGDYKSFEHVLAHEMVHAFQFDIFARGKAGGGLQTLAQVQPPLWFMEGMAEYLSLGPGHILTQSWVRDASLNGNLPTILQMTNFPNQFFPYRYGEALWEYIGRRWGDEVIGEILNASPNVGIERSFKRELGLSLEDLSDEWRESMQVKHLPPVANLDRARKFAEPLLNQRKTGGIAQLFVAPTLSPDGKLIAFIGVGSFLRGEVFPDLWLADGETGKRIKRLVKTVTQADFEELRLLYSQSAFSPDGKTLAFTAQRDGKDVLYLLDVKSRKVTRRIDVGLEYVTSPSWSPDAKQIVVSGSASGLTDLYLIDVAAGKARRITSDKYAELQPQWSPDGKSIAFATDRGDQTQLETLRFNLWRIAVMDISVGRVDVLPGQDGLNLNPQWAPDSKSIAFISDRTGIANVFLFDVEARQHYQLTNIIGSVGAFTEYSPAISWAAQADRMAFTYYENGDYTVWSVKNPRRLKKDVFKPGPRIIDVVTEAPPPPRDTVARIVQAERTADMLAAIDKAKQSADTARGADRTVSLYRSATGVRPSGDVPNAAERNGTAPVSVAALLDSSLLALPDTTRFKTYDYSVSYQPEAIYRPSVGYAQDNFGRGLYGGAGIVLGDLLGNHRVIVAGQVNGRLSEAQALTSFTNLGSRFQYTLGVAQTPIFFVRNYTEEPIGDGSARTFQTIELARYVQREAFAVGVRPRNRFTRWETGLNAVNIAVSTAFIRRGVDYANGFATDFFTDSVSNQPGFNYVAPYAAFVSDNTLFGYTGPISGRRMRFQVQPSIGGLRWTETTADYRKYFPVLFNFLTLAYRAQTSIGVGRDEQFFPKYIGRADFIRGYDREQYAASFCGGFTSQQNSCSVTELLGSRVALTNVELRFPLVRRFDLGLIPISLPPLDGLVFYDAGIAWNKGQTVSLARPKGYDENLQRYALRSYGAGIRLNLFGFALLRWDYAIPLDRPQRKGYWQFTLGPSF